MFVTIPNMLNLLVRKYNQVAGFEISIIYQHFIIPLKIKDHTVETCADGLVFDNSGPTFAIWNYNHVYNIEFGSQTDFEYRSLRRIVQGWDLCNILRINYVHFFSVCLFCTVGNLSMFFKDGNMTHNFRPFSKFSAFLAIIICTSRKVPSLEFWNCRF